MTEISVEEMKKIELQLLEKFKEICEKNGLRYFLIYGTLIGAVRHKGFIPWDDDIDVAMPRPDYEKLCSLIANKEIDNRFLLVTPSTKGHIYAFAKFMDTRTRVEEKWMLTNILGVNIDIFPLDGLPREEKKYQRFISQILRYHYALLISSRERKTRKTWMKTVLSNILYYPLRLIGYEHWLGQVIKMATSNAYEKAEHVGCVSIDTYIRKEYFEKCIFEDFEKVEFEGEQFNAPIGYDKYLKTIYGNYMELPPIESRVKKHENRAFWK